MEQRAKKPRLRRLAIPTLALVAGLGTLEVARRLYQAKRLFSPARFPEGDWDAENLGLPVEDLWFEAEDGIDLHGWWMPHPEARATLLLCHGHSGSIAHRVEQFKELFDHRLSLFAFDYRGYGNSDGRPSEKGLYRDVRAAYDFLAEVIGEEPERIVLVGQSLGGAVAIDGALHRPVAGLVVQSSFIDVKALARSAHPNLPMHLIAKNQFRSIEKVEHLPMPKLFIHGTEDEVIPIEHGRALFERAAAPKQFLAVPGANHNDVSEWGGETYFSRLAGFVDVCTRAA